MKPIPISILILFSLLFFLIPVCRSQNPAEYNGWEFIEWHTNKADAEKILKEKNITINEYITYNTVFEYNDLITRLDYDTSDQLVSVRQYIVFRDHEKASVPYYKRLKKQLIKKYGNPGKENVDENGTIKLSWELKYGMINLSFSKESPGDEFGVWPAKILIIYVPKG